MCEVEEEGLVFALFYEFAGFPTQTVGQVFAFVLLFEIRIFVRAMVSAATRASPLLARHIEVEALCRGIFPEMPFADGRCDVSCSL